ncbi:hypothetical protein DH2020_048853 [Rehmannia glutinosa]|uniref:NADH dehydrogenase [ubiquinone] iron-sulfur protein 4, mitochondrial n=1 Tax=Rehmannia glutinosa TaxID=99300 RepID=A0ABR0U4F9_REHGL
MASSLQRLASNSGKVYRSALTPLSRAFSTEDSLVEVKPGEIGSDFSPARTASQQGSGKVGRWENPLMGWTSTGDPYANVGDAGLSFDSKEAAIAFAERHGWDYTLKGQEAPHAVIEGLYDNLMIDWWLSCVDSLGIIRAVGGNLIYPHQLIVKSYADNFKWKGPPKEEEK